MTPAVPSRYARSIAGRAVGIPSEIAAVPRRPQPSDVVPEALLVDSGPTSAHGEEVLSRSRASLPVTQPAVPLPQAPDTANPTRGDSADSIDPVTSVDGTSVRVDHLQPAVTAVGPTPLSRLQPRAQPQSGQRPMTIDRLAPISRGRQEPGSPPASGPVTGAPPSLGEASAFAPLLPAVRPASESETGVDRTPDRESIIAQPPSRPATDVIETRLHSAPLQPRPHSQDLESVPLPGSPTTVGTIDAQVPSVEVSIGTVEIIAESPPLPAPVQSAGNGFAEYSALRNYEEWD
jgi:hypothetical protein